MDEKEADKPSESAHNRHVFNHNHHNLFQDIFNSLPIGLIVLRQDKTIFAWNQWMEKVTNMDADQVFGKQIHLLFNQPINPRFEWALEQVLQYRHPQVLSTMLNQFLIPIHLKQRPLSTMNKMQQDVEILPVSYGAENMALVVIQDATLKVHLKNTLLSIAAKFEKNSLVDALTGCHNRRFLFSYLDNELLAAQREGYPVNCCIFDLDHFKKINDEYGHEVGDQVLVAFCDLVKSAIRSYDYFFRYGGEEFVLITTKSYQQTLRICERIRKKFSTLSIPGVPRSITCSGGLAIWEPSMPPILAKKLLAMADKQLYASKKNGRNQITGKE